MKTIVTGFQSNSYDATFTEKTFYYEEKFVGNQKNIRITEPNSGWEIILVVEMPRRKSKKPMARKNISHKNS